MKDVYIGGTGTYLPGPPIAFDEIEDVLGELTEAPPKIQKWIKRTHPIMKELLDIDTLYYAIDKESGEYVDDNISMSVKSGRKALEMAGVKAEEVELLCYGSAHQDQMPTPSARIQAELGIGYCQEFGVHSNCTSAYKALYLAHKMISSGEVENALVISSNVSSSELRSTYLNQEKLDKASLFLRWFLCDGAGAVFLTADKSKSSGFRLDSTFTESLAGTKPSLMFNHRPAYWMNPKEEYEEARHHLRQEFQNSLSTDIFQEEGGSVFFKGFKRMAEKEKLKPDDIACFQVNMPTKHIIESIMEEAWDWGMKEDVLYSKLDQLGYCGPPMVFISLDKIVREEKYEPDAKIVSFVTEVSYFLQAGYIATYEG
jgi:3-oxoacyl-[acyl-carrier-protein] synthase III